MKNKALIAVLAAALALAAAPAGAETASQAGLEKLKSLSGEWTGTAEGKPVRVSYKVVSNGTAVMETIDDPQAVEMVTVYHLDGSSLLMTHYCAMGNQPRMRSKGLEQGKLAFVFVDASNLKSSADHVMSGLVMTFPDADHLVADWTSRGDGKEATTRFLLTRKR